jgi:hypothetical protein
VSLNYYCEKIGQILGLDVKDSECFKTLPIDVLIKLFDVLLDTLEASEDNQVALPQKMKVFVIEFWMGDSFGQEYFRCPNEALKRLLEVREIWGVDSDAEISTITVT